MKYTNQRPTDPGYYFVNNGYYDFVAHVYCNSVGVMVYYTLPSFDNSAMPLSSTRDDLLWCQIHPPKDQDQRARPDDTQPKEKP